jgi:hypothetical protein
VLRQFANKINERGDFLACNNYLSPNNGDFVLRGIKISLIYYPHFMGYNVTFVKALMKSLPF